MLDEVVEGMYERYPLEVASALGRSDRNDELSDPSVEAAEAFRGKIRRWQRRAEGIDRAGLDEEGQLNLDLLLYTTALEIAEARIHPEHTPVTNIGGPQYWLPQLASFVPLAKRGDYEDYVARLEQIPEHLDAHIEAMRAGIAAGRVPPRSVIEPAVAQAEAQADRSFIESPQKSPFYKPFLSTEERYPELAQRARELVSGPVTEAYHRFTTFLTDEYLPATRSTFGITEGVDGELAYELAIRRYTTLEMTAKEIHELGLSEVERIQGEMFEVIERSDFPGKDDYETRAELFDAFTEYLRTDERFYFDEPQELIEHYQIIAKTIDPELVKLFGRLPRLPYGVREIPMFAARFSPTAYYYNGSIEQGVPGYFMANTYDLPARPKFDAMALTLHEAVPGHHLEVSLSQEIEGRHPFRRLMSITAYTEGWALYAERLGLEMGDHTIHDGGRGLYADPYDDFGRLNYEIWRAIRLVVDTGVHAFGWTRQEAIDYMMSNSANTETDVINEVDRYIGWPGQALGYKIGELKIRELRGEAERALGEDFDIRAFHDKLLADGALPLPVLEAKMDRWVEGEGR